MANISKANRLPDWELGPAAELQVVSVVEVIKKGLDYLMGYDKKDETTNKGEKKWDLIYTH